MAVSKSKQTGAVKNFAITAAKIKIKIEKTTHALVAFDFIVFLY